MAEHPHAKPVEDVMAAFETSRDGLSDAQAEERIGRYGLNALPEEKRASVFVLLLKQFHNTLNYILLAAAGLSWFTGHAFDAGAIVFIVFLNGLIGFIQERRAEKAIEALKEMTVPVVTVRREGQVTRIEASRIVPGDIVLLSEGGRVPADMRLTEATDLRIDEAALTGESVPVQKNTEPVGAEAAVGDRLCMAYMGTLITGGQGAGIVVSTGGRTEFGRIATSLTEIRREDTPFKRRIDKLGRNLGVLAVIAASVVFIVGLLRGEDLVEMFLFAVATAVAAIPEGMPFVLAFVLSIGVWRMAKRNAVTRHMPAVETLGIVDIICSDKTGTLTENKMTVRKIATVDHVVGVTGEGWEAEGDFLLDGTKVALGEHPVITHILRVAALCNDADLVREEGRNVPVGDPTEVALVVLARKAGMEKRELLKTETTVDEVPFSSDRKYRAILHEYIGPDEAPVREIMVVGALEVLMGMSDRVMSEGAEKPLDAEMAAKMEEMNAGLAGGALRVLAVATKRVPNDKKELHASDLEGLLLHGMVGMIDPPRSGVTESVRKARRAGIRVIMNTGDHKTTAVAIAREIGMLDEGEPDEHAVFTDEDVARMSDERFEEALRTAVVFARVTPQTKLRIVKTLQAMGHAVAMTGDGVNDAPALKQADIGVAMGIVGTDVTREVADMVLADDNFNSIVNAVEEGRIVFRNVKQATGFMVMTNGGEIVTILSTMALGLPLPLLAAQILWLNVVTDSISMNAIAIEGAHGDELERPPRDEDAPVLTKDLLILTLLTSVLMAVGTIGLFMWAMERDGLDYARTVAFLVLSTFQLWNIFNMRSATRSIFHLGWFSNAWVTVAFALPAAFMALIIYVPFFRPFFRFEPVGFLEWGLAFLVGAAVIPLVEGYKILIRKGIVPENWV